MEQERNDRVFISSTCHDLIDVRAEVRSLVLAMGLNPIMSDYLDNDFETQADANSIETCLINLRTCDTVVIILSKRYGGDLSKAGFGKISATHLEYLEAKKTNKKILFFVRDRLLADYDLYKRFEDDKLLRWILPKDKLIFNFLTERITLGNDQKDNWMWTFKDSVEIKERLKIDLKDKSNQVRLHKLVESGSAPIMVCHAKVHRVPNSNQLNLNLEIYNYGNTAALEPGVIFTIGTQTYAEALDQIREGKFPKLAILKSMKSMNTPEYADFQVNYPDLDKQVRQNYSAFVLISYKSIFGDHLIDGTELNITWNNEQQAGMVQSDFRVKELVASDIYDKIIRGK